MALATDEREQNNQLNPAEDLYRREFDNIANNYGKTANDADENNAINRAKSSSDPDSSRQSIANSEKNASTPGAGAIASAVASTTMGGRITKIAAMVKTKRGAAGVGITGVIIAVLVAFGIISPSALLMGLNGVGIPWSTKYSNLGLNKRVRDQLQNRYFTNPDECKGSKLSCLGKKGVTEREIEKLRNAGFVLDVGTASDGKTKYVKSMTMNIKGKDVLVNRENVKQLHKKNEHIKRALNYSVSTRGILFRSPSGLKKFSLYNIERAKPLGDPKNEKEAQKKFREVSYGQENNVDMSPPDDSVSDDEGKQDAGGKTLNERMGDIEGLDGVSEAASEVRKDILNTGPPSLLPDTSLLSPAGALEATKTGVKGSLKGSLFGYFSSVDTACSIYNIQRKISYAAKIYQARQLIAYAMMFVVIADKQKANEVSMAEVAFLANILLKKSSMPDSKGKDFSQSTGYHLIAYNKVPKPESLARFSLGSTAMQATSAVNNFLSSKGVSAAVCKNVKSWWGQTGLLLGGVITSIGTLGTGAVAGALAGAGGALVLSYIGEVMTPVLVRMMAGAVTPDFNDPEGGYGAGNAIAVGMLAFGSSLGRSQGFRPLKKADAVALANNPENNIIAQADNLASRREGVFNPTNPKSIQNQLALKLLPVTTPKNSLTEVTASINSLFANSTKDIMPSAYADVSDEYGGKYCADKDYEGSDHAVTAACTDVIGADPRVLADENLPESLQKYSWQKVKDYMANNGYIDPETLAVKNSEYTDFTTTCFEEENPYTADGYAADLENGKDPRICDNPDEKYIYFSEYYGGMATYEGIEAAAKGTLGKVEQPTAEAEVKNTDTEKFAWPVDKSAWDKYKPDFLRGHPAGGGYLGNKNSSNDISYPNSNGTSVYAILGGTVTKVPIPRTDRTYTGSPNGDNDGGLEITSDYKGKKVVITYAHGDNVSLKQGDMVKAGDQIMTLAQVGNARRPHLHLDAIFDGKNFCTQDLFLLMGEDGEINFENLVKKADATCNRS